jgi:Arc/MetJ family transcription regulator
MRTNIDIDEDLMEECVRLSGVTTKKEIVNTALEVFIQQKKQEEILELEGELDWKGDIRAMREDRV